MESDADVGLVCLRVSEDSIASVIAGSIQKVCSECDHRVWIAKAGQNVLATHTGKVTIICSDCIMPLLAADKAALAEAAPGAIEEMIEHLRGGL